MTIEVAEIWRFPHGYCQAPSADEIDSNRADMFRNFGEKLLKVAGVADTHSALWDLSTTAAFPLQRKSLSMKRLTVGVKLQSLPSRWPKQSI